MTAKNAALALALKTGAKRYIGLPCKKHPELGGERNARSRQCLGCNRDQMVKRRRDDPDYYRRVERVSHVRRYTANPEKYRAKSRLKRTGIARETFERLLALQDGKCPVCQGSLLGGRQTHADHCHDTGKPRGVLCGPCNRAEGIIRSKGLSPEEFCRSLADYLENPTAERLNHVQDYQADQATP